MEKRPEQLHRGFQIVLTAVLLSVLLCAAVFAWYIGTNSESISTEVQGAILCRYFHSGSGTEDDPYVITRPVHFYNLVMLYQVNPTFTDDEGHSVNFIDESMYFRIGSKDLDYDGVDELDDYRVFAYDDSGKSSGQASQTLNLACYDGLLPIGTAEKPFLASFDGGNIVLDNLTVVGESDGYSTPDIGIFGYVSGNAHIENLYASNLTIDLSRVDASAADDGDVHTEHSGKAYAGYIAGHIKTSASVEDVYVNGCTIVGGNAAADNFGYFGRVDDESDREISTIGSEIAATRVSGSDAGFGGSVNMYDLFQRAQAAINRGDNRYPSVETIVAPDSPTSGYASLTVNQTAAIPSNSFSQKYWGSATAGSYIGSVSGSYTYIYGISTHAASSTTTTGKSGEEVEAWFISSGRNYLAHDGASLSSAASSGRASKWMVNSVGSWYCYDNGAIRYLNAAADGSLSAETSVETDATRWQQDSDGRFFTELDGRTCYLIYSDGWTLTDVTSLWSISSGELPVQLMPAASGVTSGSRAQDSFVWVIEDPEGESAISLLDGRYLGFDGGSLTLSETPTLWQLDGTGRFVTLGGVNFYLTYDGTWTARPESGYLISDGDDYLTLSAGDVAASGEGGACLWLLSDPEGNTSIASFSSSGKVYLAPNGSAPTLSSEPFTWTRDGDSFYCSSNGVNWYLACRNGSWVLLSDETRVYLKDGSGGYMKSDLSSAASASSALLLRVTNPAALDTDGASTSFATEDGRFLSAATGRLSLASTGSSWTRVTRDGSSGYTTTVQGATFHLACIDGAWTITPAEGLRITDGGNYLCLNQGSLANGTDEASASLWHRDGDALYTISGGSRYYLAYSGGLTVATGSQSALSWTQSSDGNGYVCSLNGGTYALLCSGGSWTLQRLDYSVITDGAGNYLRITGTGNTSYDNVTDISAASVFTAPADGGSGYISTSYGGSTVYLRQYNGALQLTTGTSNRTTWRSENGSIYTENGSAVHALGYSGTDGWHLETSYTGWRITDGKGNYLRITGTGNQDIANTTNVSDATVFTFSAAGDNASGTVSASYGGSTVYLRRQNGSLRTTTSSGNASSWTNDGNVLSNGSYHLRCSNGTWQLTTDSAVSTTYRISYDGHYMAASGTSLTVTDDPDEALEWSGTSGSISTRINGTTYYLSSSGNTSGSAVTLSSSGRSWTNSGNHLYYTSSIYRSFVNYTGSAWAIDRTSFISNDGGVALSFTQAAVKAEYSSLAERIEPAALPSSGLQSGLLPAPALSLAQWTEEGTFPVSHELEEFTAPELAAAFTEPVIDAEYAERERQLSLTFTETTETGYDSVTEPYVRGSYIPLRIAVDGDDEYDPNDLYRVSRKNTGYIVGGTYSAASSSGRGDIRISRYSNTNISSGYSGGNMRTIYTYNGGSSPVAITDAYKQSHFTPSGENRYHFDDALDELDDTLDNSEGNVYGIHFMDSAISTDHLITAEAVTVNGKTYVNYQLPESSIDFEVYERGYITFFAGDYYSNNNAFFSLHQIFRTEDKKISVIREIAAVYQHSSLKGAKPYVYRYTDGTYTNADGSYTGSQTLPAGYTQVVDMAWITNPRNGSNLSGSNIYYFEIPANAGEYALGSVSGRTGAYLLYLDIATNGGDVKSTIVSSEGNEVANSFRVDYRDPFDRLDGRSVLQFAISAPGGTDASSFSVRVDFDNSDTTCLGTAYEQGLYTISVVNHSGEQLELDVLLCDDNDVADDPFLYAYRIYYENDGYSTVILTATGDECFQAMSSFRIPASDAAFEYSYSS